MAIHGQSEPIAPEMQALKERLKATWEAGDYGHFSQYLEPGALEFFERLQIPPGVKMLDLACGAGQLTIPAARRGIRVIGLDLAQNLVDRANERLRAENLEGEVIQGDAEDLPFEDNSFDVVLTLIGAMFAPRPHLVAKEMLRVCRPGGQIIMGNWTPTGTIGELFKVVAKHVPPPPIFPAPVLWGTKEAVEERLGQGLSELRMTARMYPFRFPFGPSDVADWFIAYYGPTHRAFNTLEGAARDAFRQDLIEFWTRVNTGSENETTMQAEYLEVIGTVRA